MSLDPSRQIPADYRQWLEWCNKQQPQARPITPVNSSTPYTVADGDSLLAVDDDAIGSAVVVNLPSASINEGRELQVKKMGSTGTITIDPSGSETIDDQETLIISIQYDTAQIISDGTQWLII